MQWNYGTKGRHQMTRLYYYFEKTLHCNNLSIKTIDILIFINIKINIMAVIGNSVILVVRF